MTRARNSADIVSGGFDIPAESLDNAPSFDAGTVMLFQQTSAPTGWTKDTTNNNDSAIRIVTGSVATGGSTGFATAMATPSVTGTVGLSGALDAGNLATSISGNISNTTLSNAQIPSHTHSYIRMNHVGNGYDQQGSIAEGNRTTTNTGASGGGGSHNHGHNLSGSTTGAPGLGNLAGSISSATASLNVKYVDVIVATKD